MALPKALQRTPHNPNRHIAHQVISCLCGIRPNDGTKWPENLVLHLANQIHLNDHYESSQLPVPVTLASLSLSGTQCIAPHTHGLWAPRLEGKWNDEIDSVSTILTDKSDISLTQSFRGRCSPVLWTVPAAFSLTLPPIRTAFNHWLPPARKNEMVRNLLGFIIMHNNLLYITT